MNTLFEAALQKEVESPGHPDLPGLGDFKGSRRSHGGKKMKQKQKEWIDLTQEQAVLNLTQQTQMIDLTVDKVIQSHLGPGLSAGPSHSEPGPGIENLKKMIKTLVMDIVGSSKKWTWGIDLTEADLREMVRGVDRVGSPHSGYDLTLGTGSELSTVSDYLDPAAIEDINDNDLRFDALSPDVMSVRSLEPHEFPVAFTRPPLHHLSACDTDTEPDSVFKAFWKSAVKRQVIEETQGITELYSDEELSPHLPPFPLYPSPTNKPALADPDPFPCPIVIASDDGLMDVSMSDDGMATVPVQVVDMQTSPPSSDQPGPGVPMMVVLSDSDSDSDDGSGGRSATFLVPNFDEELPTHIPTAVM